MTVLDNIIQRAQAAPKRIVLTEGEDSRILQAAERLSKDKVAEITILGDATVIAETASEQKLKFACKKKK